MLIFTRSFGGRRAPSALPLAETLEIHPIYAEGLGDFEIYSSLQCSMIILCRFIKQNFGTAILVIPKWAGHQAIVIMGVKVVTE